MSIDPLDRSRDVKKITPLNIGMLKNVLTDDLDLLWSSEFCLVAPNVVDGQYNVLFYLWVLKMYKLEFVAP